MKVAISQESPKSQTAAGFRRLKGWQPLGALVTMLPPSARPRLPLDPDTLEQITLEFDYGADPDAFEESKRALNASLLSENRYSLRIANGRTTTYVSVLTLSGKLVLGMGRNDLRYVSTLVIAGPPVVVNSERMLP